MASSTNGVVLVTVDSFRADAVGEHTPTLRGLSERATTFERAYAHGNWTPFSFPSVLGSDAVFAEGARVGPSSAPTLAERLREAGARTGGVNAANGFLTDHWGYDRGFDRFETFTGDARTPIGRFFDSHPTVRGWMDFFAWPLRRLNDRLHGREAAIDVDTSNLGNLEREATAFLDSLDDDEPFFLWVHYMDTHTPYVPAPRHLRAVAGGRRGALSLLRGQVRAGFGRDVDERTLSALRAAYDAAARQVDESIGRLLDALTDRGRREDAAVVVAGDHGEEFLEHGHLAHYPKPYRELAHVPLIVDAPGGPARRIERPVGLSAVPPTICEALGADRDGLAASLWPVVTGTADGDAPPADPVTTLSLRGDSVTQQPIPRRLGQGTPVVAARTERWTYVYHDESGHRELYDRAADPGETDDRAAAAADNDGRSPTAVDLPNLAAAVPEAPVERLHAAVDARIDALGDDDGSAADTPDDVQRRLEALGYA